VGELRVIVRLHVPVAVGTTTKMDFHEGGTVYSNVPIYVLRESTEEEWIQDRVEQGYDEESARRESVKRQRQFPNSRCYEVNMD
jgi:hypothetical protein